MKPTLAQSTKPVTPQAPVVVEQPPPSRRGRGCRSWRPFDTLLLIGLALSLAILSVSVVWSLRPHVRGFVQAKCVIVEVQQVQPRNCSKLPQCYSGRHVYNDDKTGWCDAIEVDEQQSEEESRKDENQRQRRSASHERPDNHNRTRELPDDDTGPYRDGHQQGPAGLHGPRGQHGPHKAPGPHRRHGQRDRHTPGSRETPESLTSTTAPGALARQGQPTPCTLVAVDVNSRHGDTWAATLYSTPWATATCSECSFRTCVDRLPIEGEWLSCYYHRDEPGRVFVGHLHGRWSGRRRIVCPVVFAAIFLVFLVLRRVYLCCVVPGHQVGFTGGIVYAVPPVDKSEKTTTVGGLSSDRDLEASAPPKYAEVAANERPPDYDEALTLESKNELVLTPIAQA